MFPQQIGPYKVLKRLGAGGMGVVYQAEGPTGHVALKTVQRPQASTLASLRGEVRALRRLDHPGVVRFLDHGTEEGLPWYAMELLEGRTLHAMLRDAWQGTSPRNEQETQSAVFGDLTTSSPSLPPAPPRRPVSGGGRLQMILDTFRALCEPLAFVHGEGMIHRDLKPENVFLRDRHGPVLVDFGLSTEFPGGRAAREATSSLGTDGGTAAYISPEQIMHDPADARADLYAFGSMLFEALAGRPPFLGNMDAVHWAKLSEAAPSLDQLVDGTPAPLVDLVAALLARSPLDRPGHADDVARELEALGATPFRYESARPARPYLYRPTFVGRSDEVERVATHMRGVVSGSPARIVELRGETGIGRSRFLLEVARVAPMEGLMVVAGACEPDSPLGGLRPALQAAADAVQAGAAVEAVFGGNAPVLALFEPVIAGLPGVAEQGPMQTLRPENERIRVLAAVEQVLRYLARRRPLLLVIDDFERADELTRAFVTGLRKDHLPRLSVVVSVHAAAEGIPNADESLTLNPLTEREVGALVASMLGTSEAPEGIAEQIKQRTGGIPFYAAEFLRAAINGGVLGRASSGAWINALSPDAPLALPSTIGEIVETDLARVPEAASATLQMAALMNGNLSPELIPDADIDALTEARVMRFNARGRLAFVNPLAAEVVRQRVPTDQLKPLHLAAANLLKGEVEPGTQARIAHHLLAGGEEVRAFEPTMGAAEEAMRTAAFGQGLRLLSTASELAERHGLLQDPARKVAFQVLLGRCRWGVGQATESRAAMERALEIGGQPLGDSAVARAVDIIWGLIREAWRLRRPDPQGDRLSTMEADLAEGCRYLAYHAVLGNEALRFLQAALRGADHGTRSGRGKGADLATLGLVTGFAGLEGLSRRWFERARERVTASRDRSDEVIVNVAAATLALGRARWEELFAYATVAERLCEQIGDLEQLGVIVQLTSTAHMISGNPQRGVERARFVCEESRTTMPRIWARTVWAACNIQLGDASGAAEHCERALQELGAESKDAASLSNLLATLADARSLMGEQRPALETARRAVAVSGAGAENGFGAWPVHNHVPQVFLRAAERGDAEALEDARRATRSAMVYGRRFAIGRAQAHRYQGWLHRLEGRHAAAVASLRECTRHAAAHGLPCPGAAAHLELARLMPMERAQHVAEARALLAGRRLVQLEIAYSDLLADP